ncbi:MAG TPA: hypothetical protein VH951_11975 [Dehalococcoidia bacterium]
MTSSDAGEVKPVELKMTAVGSGREVDLASLLQPVLFVAFGQETQAGSDPVEQVARARYKPSDLLVVSLIDLHKIPSLIRKMAEGVLNNEHKKAVEALPAGADPYEYVVVLPDWKGEAVKSLGLTDATKAIGLALVDTAGRVQWRYQGAEPAPALEARFASNPL